MNFRMFSALALAAAMPACQTQQNLPLLAQARPAGTGDSGRFVLIAAHAAERAPQRATDRTSASPARAAGESGRVQKPDAAPAREQPLRHADPLDLRNRRAPRESRPALPIPGFEPREETMTASVAPGAGRHG